MQVRVEEVADRLRAFTDAVRRASAAHFPRFSGEPLKTPEERTAEAYAAHLSRLTQEELLTMHRLLGSMLNLG